MVPILRYIDVALTVCCMVVAHRDMNAAPQPVGMDKARFKERRESHGLTLTRLAELVGVDRNTLRRWVDGTSTPRLDTAMVLAAHLETTVDGPDGLWSLSRSKR